MQKTTPFLWFDSQAEEVAEFYTGILKFENPFDFALSRGW
jgi:predicted 3-demethylubiquinone-9 3-methyltransferase (glyoxalase superfamily)